jgi:hypothetical protein
MTLDKISIRLVTPAGPITTTYNFTVGRRHQLRMGPIRVEAATGHFHSQPDSHVVSLGEFIMAPEQIIATFADQLPIFAIRGHVRFFEFASAVGHPFDGVWSGEAMTARCYMAD